MCNTACVQFAWAHLGADDVAGKRVIEVGSFDVNGSLRPWIESLGPASYVGVDITEGPGVDVICDASALVARFGAESFDVVISTEMLEHVRAWRSVVSNLKNLLRPGGVLLVTTRSVGFGYHGYPSDFWRYSDQDFRRIFADMTIHALSSDPECPGIFLKAERPVDFVEQPLDSIQIYSILKSKRCDSVSDFDAWWLGHYWRVRPALARWVPRWLERRIRGVLARRRARHA